MTTEERNLLIKDLCARVPYDTVVCTPNAKEAYLRSVDTFGYEVEVADYNENIFDIEDVKPYLRPMSSMTEEEVNEFNTLVGYEDRNGFIRCNNLFGNYGIDVSKCSDMIDWLNSNHFDYRWLIEKGLAIEASAEMYNIILGVYEIQSVF